MASGKLTPKQERFVAEYLIDLNATQAAARAGYKDPNIGRQLITKNNVAAAIAREKQAQKTRTNITADRVLEELAAIGFAELGDYTGANKLRALELLGKHLGLFEHDQQDWSLNVILAPELEDWTQ